MPKELNTNLWLSVIIVVIAATLLVILVIVLHFLLNKLKEKLWPDNNRKPSVVWIKNNWIVLETVIMSALIIFLILVENSFLEALFKNIASQINGSILFSTFTIIGTGLTVFAAFLAYEHYKIGEDKIENYHSLYNAVEDIFRDKKGDMFQMWGTTLIPGHVVHREENDKKTYICNLKNTHDTDADGRFANENSEFILLDENMTQKAYSRFNGYKLRNAKTCDSKMISDCVDKIKEIRDVIGRKAKIIDVTNDSDARLIESFYFSNGRLAVFALPLHGVGKQLDEKISDASLVGFKTRNPIIVQALKDKFFDIRTKLSEK